LARVTIVDVARRAGVSPTAVSFAYNDPAQLSAATAARILATGSELGYAPNPYARALHSRRVGVLGVLVPQDITSVFDNPFFPVFLQGVGAVADEEGLALLTVSPLRGSLEKAISRAPVDGFLIVGLNEWHDEVAPLLKRGVPCVIVDGDARTLSSVNVADEAGTYSAARHLLTHGHRDILLLSFETPYGHEDAHYGVGGRRLRGYERACTEWDVPAAKRKRWLRPTSTSVAGGMEAFAEAWDDGLRPTAVLTVSDAMAVGAMRVAAARGVRVPEDIEVIGFDDLPLASLVQPALSTVRQPIVDKARAATELLVAALEGNSSAHQVTLPTELVLRESTR